jgi:hypothetical protein
VSTYLQLCQKLRRQAGSVAGTGPVTVLSQTGQLQKIVEWTQDAWLEIQGKHDNWFWMRSSFTLNTVGGTDTYAFGAATDTRAGATITRFKRWWADDPYWRFTGFLAAGGVGAQYWLNWMPWNDFRQIYKFGNQQTVQGPPAHVTVDPDRQIVLGPIPDAVYTIRGDYQRGPQILAANGDTPDMPEAYHDLIVYRAMEKAGADSIGAEVFQRGVYEGNRMLRQLEMNQLPMIMLAETLA